MKTSLLNRGELINSIDKRIKGSEYKNFPSTKERLRQIMIKLLKNIVELPENDVYTLKSDGFINA